MSEASGEDLLLRWHRTRQEVAELARRSGRRPEEIRIIAASKKQPASAIRILAENGQRDFGENYVQEALDKQTALDSCAARWHFLGRLQRNKAKFIPQRFVMLHSLDSMALARILQDKCEVSGVVLDVLLQVNIGQEPQKSGVTEADLLAVAQDVAGMSALALRGLMVLPPFALDLSEKQGVFARLRELRDRLEMQLGQPMGELSMGTTDDYPQAIAEGATMVRIGTRIFGPRAA